MNPGPVLAAAAALALLGACSPAPKQPAAGETARPAATAAGAAVGAAAGAEPVEDELAPVLDGEGNELDPELADAVRAKLAQEQETGGSEPDE